MPQTLTYFAYQVRSLPQESLVWLNGEWIALKDAVLPLDGWATLKVTLNPL